jgi:hypothetical protein
VHYLSLFQFLEQSVPKHGILGNLVHIVITVNCMRGKPLLDLDVVSWVVEEALGRHTCPKIKDVSARVAN